MLLWIVPGISVGSPDTPGLSLGDFIPMTEKMHLSVFLQICVVSCSCSHTFY